MIDRHGTRLLLCDFGFGRQCSIPLSPTYTAEICTLWYRPPELLLGSRSYGAEVDLWAAGLTVAEMLLGKPMLTGDNDLDQLMRIFELLGTPTERTWPSIVQLPEYKPESFPNYRKPTLDARMASIASEDLLAMDFVRSTLRYVPNQRLSAKRALLHPFLSVYLPQGSRETVVTSSSPGSKKRCRQRERQAAPQRRTVALASQMWRKLFA